MYPALDSVQTDSNGNYIFSKIIKGTYGLILKTKLPWAGVNPVDALLINRYYIKSYTFGDNLMKSAADS